MCRMILQYSLQPRTISMEILRSFIKSCHWGYFNNYDLIGHHGAGWGVSYITNDSQQLVIKRSLQPIYKFNWQDLLTLKTRFLIIHARKSIFGERRLQNVHPINVEGKYCLVHNGTIKMSSFPDLNDAKLHKIQKNTDLDTKRYLCTILDNFRSQKTLEKAIEATLKEIEVSSAANGFLFNLNECHIIKYQNSTFNGRHTTLFIDKFPNRLLISTTPLTSTALEIPNQSLLSIPALNSTKLTILFKKLAV